MKWDLLAKGTDCLNKNYLLLFKHMDCAFHWTTKNIVCAPNSMIDYKTYV